MSFLICLLLDLEKFLRRSIIHDRSFCWLKNWYRFFDPHLSRTLQMYRDHISFRVPYFSRFSFYHLSFAVLRFAVFHSASVSIFPWRFVIFRRTIVTSYDFCIRRQSCLDLIKILYFLLLPNIPGNFCRSWSFDNWITIIP